MNQNIIFPSFPPVIIAYVALAPYTLFVKIQLTAPSCAFSVFTIDKFFHTNKSPLNIPVYKNYINLIIK